MKVFPWSLAETLVYGNLAACPSLSVLLTPALIPQAIRYTLISPIRLRRAGHSPDLYTWWSQSKRHISAQQQKDCRYPLIIGRIVF